MGCFLGCFGASKHDNKRLKTPPHHHNPDIGKHYSPPIQQTVAPKKDFLEEPIKPLVLLQTRVKPEEEKLSLTSEGKQEEQQSSLGTRKRVTFNSDVKEYEHVSCDEAPEILDEDEIEVDRTNPGKPSSSSESGSTLSSLGTFSPNLRYQNCRESDDEDDELHCQVSDLDEDEDLEVDEDEADDGYDGEYSDDEYYSRRVPEISTRSCSSVESGTKQDHESLDKETVSLPGFHRGARDRAGYVHSVLNPVENTTQWKYIKAKRTPPLKYQKENFQMDQSFKQSSSKSKSIGGLENHGEVAVDASLSTWLDSSKKTPPSKAIKPVLYEDSISSDGSNSMRFHEERPILGALTMEELKQLPSPSPPRRSPSRGINEKPLVGTVGMHWNDRIDSTPIEDPHSSSSFKGIPNTTSKYREDKRVNWHSTPFETRLERALNRGACDSRT